MKKLKISLLFLIVLLPVVGIFLVVQPLFITSDISKYWENTEKANTENLEKYVKELSSTERFTDIWLEKASSYILKILWKNKIKPENIEIQKYTIWEREYRNIIVHFKSENLHRKQLQKIKTYVIWAHYDSHKKLPAADDNASGVAGLLEISRILINQKLWNKNIDLVFYSTEEMPHFRTQSWMGSYHHAQENQNIELAIILEMIGYFSEEEASQDFPVWTMKYLYWDTGNFIALVSNFDNISPIRKIKGYFSAYLEERGSIWVKSINAPASIVPAITRSDHSSYWKFDIPAIMISDTAFLRNKNYHTAEDTYERLNYKKMGEVVNGVVVSILNL